MPVLRVQMPDSRYDKDENWERCNIQILSAAYQKTPEIHPRLICCDCIRTRPWRYPPELTQTWR